MTYNKSLLRSLLFVPATPKRLAKVLSLKADAYIFDLEDSIPIGKKEEALEELLAWLDENENNSGSKWYVRVNLDRLVNEISCLAKYSSIAGFMIPKYESNDCLLSVSDKIQNKEIIALIETPRGMINVSSIAKDEFVSALAFGAEDYTAAINMKNDDTKLAYAKSKIVLYGVANQKSVYDTPSFTIRELDIFNQEADDSVAYGFTGKLAIHPNQVEIINNVFNQHDYAYLEKIVEEYEKQGGGILQFDGKIYELPHINHIKNILESRTN